MAAAEARRAELVAQIQQIDVDLGNKNREIGGVRQSDHEWHQWRTKALGAKRFIAEELRLTKAWVRDRRNEGHAALTGVATPQDSAVAMLARAYRLLRALQQETDLTAEELAEIDAIQAFFTTQGCAP